MIRTANNMNRFRSWMKQKSSFRTRKELTKIKINIHRHQNQDKTQKILKWSKEPPLENSESKVYPSISHKSVLITIWLKKSSLKRMGLNRPKNKAKQLSRNSRNYQRSTQFDLSRKKVPRTYNNLSKSLNLY